VPHPEVERRHATSIPRDVCSADVPSEVSAGPGRRSSRSVPPVALAGCSRSRGRPPPQCTCPSLAFRTFPSCCSPSPAQLHGLDAPGARRDPLESRCAASHLGLAFGVLAEPSWIRSPFGSCDPASPGTSSLADGPSPDGPVNVHSRRTSPPSVDGCHTVDLAPSSWFFTTSTVSAVHGFRHVAAGTGSGFARFWSGRSSKPKLLGPGPSSPLARHPAKFSPRRQPYHITAACSPPAGSVHLVRRRGVRAGSRVLLHRRVRVLRRRCRRRVTRSFLGFVSPSRRCLHHRWCPRSPEDPIPLPVCVWAALPSRVTRRTAESVCPGWEL